MPLSPGTSSKLQDARLTWVFGAGAVGQSDTLSSLLLSEILGDSNALILLRVSVMKSLECWRRNEVPQVQVLTLACQCISA